MARTDTLVNFLSDVAESIRQKRETTDVIEPKNFDIEIENIETNNQIIPDQGWYISNYNENKMPSEITVVGYEELPTISLGNNFMTSTVKKIIIDNNITKPAKGSTFSSCSSVEEIVLPNNFSNFTPTATTTYGTSSYSVFGDCTSLKKIEGPIKRLWSTMFSGCESLVDIDLSSFSGVLPGYCFRNCKSLNWTELPSGVTKLASSDPNNSNQYRGVFQNCTNLALTHIKDNVEWTTTGKYTYNGEYMFDGCENLALSKIPSIWTTIGNYAFRNCKKITISDLSNVKYMGDYAFQGCTSLKEIILAPTDLAGSYGHAFENCTGLEKVTFIGGTETSIISYMFSGCTSLLEVILWNTITSLGEYVFYNCSNLQKISLMDNVKTIGNYCFYNCVSLNSISSTENVTTINNYSFSGCTNLKKITLTSLQNLIGTATFANTILESVSLPSIVKFGTTSSTLSSNAFYNTPIKAIWLGNTLTTLNRYAFNGLTTLKKVFIDLPRQKVESLSYYSVAFSNNTISTDVIVCNDDEDFISLEEFESIDWGTNINIE